MASKTATIADVGREFAKLFAGLERAHGRYLTPREAKPNAVGKIEGKAWTTKKEITREDWEAHLSDKSVTVADGEEQLTGSLGLGVVPIRDDTTCVFGAIDIDVYPLDLKELAADVRSLELPLVLCRTKSGGAHLYLFMNEPAPAELVRDSLMQWAMLLGYPGVEVFPKQTRLAGENDDGSWISLPYAGGARSTRYALVDDVALTPEEFVRHAYEMMLSEQGLRDFEANIPEAGEDDDLWLGAPPCLTVLAKRGFAEGSRNNALFNVAIYLKKRYGDDEFGEHLDTYNQQFMSPPLGSGDVQTIIKSARKKSYTYKCKDAPIISVCNRQLCLKCDHGIGGGRDDPGVVLGELVKVETTPPTWIWDINGARIELTTGELTDQRAFHQKVIDVLNVWPLIVKPGTWQTIVRERLSRAEVVEVPADATKEGQLWVHLSRFCTSRVVGRSLDELLLGKPFTDAENKHSRGKRTYFCAADFLSYLQQHRFGGVDEKFLFKWLRRKGVEHHFFNLKGKGVNCWSVAAFEEQTEDHEVPRAPVTGAM